VFSLLFTPIGRYIAVGVAVLLLISGVYLKIRADAAAEIEATATADALKRTQNAITAGDSLNLSPDRLRDPDRNQRD